MQKYFNADGRLVTVGDGVDFDFSGYSSVTELTEDQVRNFVPEIQLTLEQVYALRAAAYADPHAGSDRHFAEAARKRAKDDTAGADAATAAGLARAAEIKAEYPLP